MSASTTTRIVLPCALFLLGFSAVIALASPLAFVEDVQCAVTEPVCILVVPDGSGTTFASARTINGEVVDATIAVQIWLIDEFGPIGPIANFAAEELTIQAPDGLTHGCEQANVAAADQNTDTDGWTRFSLAPRAGGWSQDLLEIYVNGDPASQIGSDIPPLPIYFNSPDINGDLHINLTDVTMLTQDILASEAPFRSDLVWDGVINLSDITVFTQHIGATCP